MFIRVDLPAPFSPSKAWTSPLSTSRSMWSFARTPGNCLVIPRSSRAASAMSGDPNPETREGGHQARPLDNQVELAYRAPGALTEPAMSCFCSAAMRALNAAGTFELILPSETPEFFRLKTRSVPPVRVPACAALTVKKTPVSTRLTALVRMCGPRYDWSTSTPTPQTLCSFAACSAPRPHGPATLKTTCEPAAIWFDAIDLHLSCAMKSCEYPMRVLVPGTHFAAPAR